MILSTLIAQFGDTGITPPTKAFSDRSNEASGVTAATNIEAFISNGLGALTLIGGLMFIFYFAMGGLNWITAGGEQGKIQKARDQMIQGVIGLVVIVMSYALIGIVGTFIGFDLLRPGKTFIDNLSPLGK